ncbi:EamA family transporter [Phreatobacter stygius]|uniref:EamA family transporter n=1 Tax=Phreatobacter stygius TaxID=1940610 RepID=A0A4D7AV12_9HYPH|nr:EamA family transporter [Phreatobacter stygius]QCI65584.1 EamA family transporter [Phreatobacter stygius]
MKPVDVALALLVTLVWGVAFVLTKVALETISPPLLMAVRFLVAALPVLFVARPGLPWPLLVGLGLTLFVGQFLFQFIGIAQGVPPGLASVIVQSQALFTVGFAAALLGQVPTQRQIGALVIATAGLVCIAGTIGEEFDARALLLILVSPVSFALGNVLLKRAGETDMFGLIAWLSLVPPLPGLALAAAIDGPASIWRSAVETPALGWIAAGYLGLVATTFGYAAWGRLIRRYSAATIAPFALLVPFVGAAASSLVFGEAFGPLRLTGMALVLAGLALLLMPATSRRPA